MTSTFEKLQSEGPKRRAAFGRIAANLKAIMDGGPLVDYLTTVMREASIANENDCCSSTYWLLQQIFWLNDDSIKSEEKYDLLVKMENEARKASLPYLSQGADYLLGAHDEDFASGDPERISHAILALAGLKWLYPDDCDVLMELVHKHRQESGVDSSAIDALEANVTKHWRRRAEDWDREPNV